MISDAHNQGYQSVQVMIDRFEHGVEDVPVVVASSKAIVIDRISSQNYNIRIEIFQVACH